MDTSPTPPEEPAAPAGAVPVPGPIPAWIRALRIVLWWQAGAWAVGALIGLIAYFLGPGDPSLGWYARLRTHPAVAVVLATAVTVVLVRFTRQLAAPQYGLRRQIRGVEVLLLLDAAISLVAGVFNLWLVIGVLAAVVALVYLHTEDTKAFLV